jgi:putative ABC transport system permease protein
MIRNYIKIALRVIKRNKVYSFLNIFGLATGMAAFILISLYVSHELSFDRYHKNADSIYRVAEEIPFTYMGSNKFATTPAPLAAALVNEYPEVVSSTRFRRSEGVLFTHGDKSFLEEMLHWTDPQTFYIFSYELIKGDKSTILQDPFSILLSEKTARKFFGSSIKEMIDILPPQEGHNRGSISYTLRIISAQPLEGRCYALVEKELR